MKKIFTANIVVMLSVILLLTSCVPPNTAGGNNKTMAVKDTVVIGFMAPLSGDAASYGLSVLKGAQLAVKEAGLKNVKLVTEDSQCDAKEAVSAVNKLISVNKAKIIIGEVCNSATLAAAPIAEKNKVIMISPASTSPELTKNQWVFRTVPSDSLQAGFAAKLMDDKGYENVAILYSDEEYGNSFSAALEKKFDGDITASESFESGTADFQNQLDAIKDSDADALFIISNSQASSIAILKQVKEMKLDLALFGSDALHADEIVTGAGKAAEGLTVTAINTGNVGFITKYQREYNSEPGPFAAQAYDAFKAVALVVEQGAATGEEIQKALQNLDFQGASGAINFDTGGDVSGNYNVYVVNNGKFEVQ